MGSEHKTKHNCFLPNRQPEDEQQKVSQDKELQSLQDEHKKLCTNCGSSNQEFSYSKVALGRALSLSGLLLE